MTVVRSFDILTSLEINCKLKAVISTAILTPDRSIYYNFNKKLGLCEPGLEITSSQRTGSQGRALNFTSRLKLPILLFHECFL